MLLKVYVEEADSGEGATFTPTFGLGETNDAYAAYFTGQSYLNPLTSADEAGVAISNVTFEPGCRNNWHIHHADKGGGQVLIVTDGRGLVPGVGQGAAAARARRRGGYSRGREALARAPPADSWMSHLAYGVPGETAPTSGSSRWTTRSIRRPSSCGGARGGRAESGCAASGRAA